jgi:nucleotide-binding universal stress UspA family protein
VLEIRSILAPTDFSRHAEGALRYAFGLSQRFSATLHLLHVLPDVVVPVGPDPSLTPSLPPDYYTETETRSREALLKVIDPSWPNPPGVEVAVRWGGPVDAIVAYAADRSIGLIVIATHGRTGLSHALLGSVAERIVREAPCPVLTIRSR